MKNKRPTSSCRDAKLTNEPQHRLFPHNRKNPSVRARLTSPCLSARQTTKLGQSLLLRNVYRLWNHNKDSSPTQASRTHDPNVEITTATLHNILVKDSKLNGGEKKKSQDRHPENLMVDAMSFQGLARDGSFDRADQVSLLKAVNGMRAWHVPDARIRLSVFGFKKTDESRTPQRRDRDKDEQN